MESGSDDGRLLINMEEDSIRIDTTDEALQRVNDAIEGDTNHSELDYLTAVRDVIRYTRSQGFDAENGIDVHPPGTTSVDEDELAGELEELEQELENEESRASDGHTDADG